MAAWMKPELGGASGLPVALANRLGGRWGVLAAFVVIDITLQFIGHTFQERYGTPTVLWPASGFVLAAFWMAGRSWWPALGVLHVLVETFTIQGNSALSSALVGCADVLESSVGAALCQLWIREPARIRTRQVALFVLAAALGTLAGALAGTLVATSYRYPGMDYWSQMQAWWVGNWLGSVSAAPLLFVWTTALWKRIPELRLRSRTELAAFCMLLPAISWYVFTTPAGHVGSVLQLPVMVFAVLALAAFRLPPRWAMTLATLVVWMVAWFAVHHVGAFALQSTFDRLVHVQTTLATVSIVTFLMANAITEMRVTAGFLRASDYRYRSFVQMSSEAVWCVELSEPMPLSLPADQMLAWMRRHGRISECSKSYYAIDPDAQVEEARPARGDSVWSDLYRRYLEQVAGNNYSCTDFQVVVKIGGRQLHYLASFDGVVEEQHLQRIWGVARDVTELVELNSRLSHEQERLRGYARALVTAEDRARRATAVDLHDGIGQSLMAIGMRLEAARSRAEPASRLLLDEIKLRLIEVQERTRSMISDLSPPGLYELGLAPALSWLMVFFRSNEGLDAKLDCRVQEERIRLELRILVFKLVRELLRNVVKHAGVATARVSVQGDANVLRVEVRDEGRGFEWQQGAEATRGGFGLWSMVDRIREVGGRLSVHTAPGCGAHFELEFPLGDGAPASGLRPHL